MLVSSQGAESSRHIGVLFALPEEAAPFLRLPKPDGVTISVEISGMGAAKAAEAACQLLSKTPPIDTLIICGFGGGLGYQAAGDLMLVHRVLDGTQNPKMPRADLCADPVLIKLGNKMPFRLLCGALATTHRVLITSQEKNQLFAQTEANAVDMETAGAARVAHEAGIPWIAVRALTDGANDDLPFDFNLFSTSDGQTNCSAVIRAVFRNPLKIPALIRLGVRSSHAAKLLAGFLSFYIPAIIRTTESQREGESTEE